MTMLFTVTYRDRTGARREAAIEAASRAACVAACKARGIAPMAVREGGSNKNAASPKGTGRQAPQGKRRAIVLSVLVVLALGAWWWFAAHPKGAPQPVAEKPKFTKRPTVAVRPDARSVRPREAPEGIVEAASVLPTDGYAVVHADAAAVSNYVATHYTTNSAVRPIDPNDPDLPLITGVNQELGSLMSTEMGDPVPPFPYSFLVEDSDDQNDEFLKSLKHKVALRETDSQKRAAGKQKLLQARLDLLDAMDQGLSVKDAIKTAYIQRVRAYEARCAYIADLQDWARENPDVAEFRRGVEETNRRLAEKGIKKITADDLGIEGFSDEPQHEEVKENENKSGR